MYASQNDVLVYSCYRYYMWILYVYSTSFTEHLTVKSTTFVYWCMWQEMDVLGDHHINGSGLLCIYNMKLIKTNENVTTLFTLVDIYFLNKSCKYILSLTCTRPYLHECGLISVLSEMNNAIIYKSVPSCCKYKKGYKNIQQSISFVYIQVYTGMCKYLKDIFLFFRKYRVSVSRWSRIDVQDQNSSISSTCYRMTGHKGCLNRPTSNQRCLFYHMID